ncbi:2044_t:CDS:2 [Cetraspora pellucida]|uniref:2044_t:CDS:1 n=1 Tax=Cetraspora pellucida TaxID=1433469 RepID=A0A9N9P1S0_9GLOM|nr:2044_t:CDS:2 [Cetraspora pellucida]
MHICNHECLMKSNYNIRVKARLNSHLLLEDSNRVKLSNLLDNGAPGVIEHKWDLSNEEQIINRDQFLQKNGLDINTDDVCCKWSIRQTTKTQVIKQCIGGSYHKKEVAPNSRASAARYPYVGCLAFAAIYIYDNEICGIAGFLEHSVQCMYSQLQNDPPYRLLPYVRQNVESLLNLNVRTSDILAQNARTVKNVFRNSILIGDFRMLLTTMDIANIKKQMLQKTWNVNIKHDAAKNLDQFLGQNADQSGLKEACLHYQPHTRETDRLEIIISTREQQDYAWQYGHKNLILVDGTFGISKHKLLLFTIMVIDKNNKGIPIAFILFTPPQYNRLTSSGNNYNQTQVNSNVTPVTFSSLVAITDTDVKERKALSKVWPRIILLLCYFHISQCWKNEINKQLGRGGKGDAILQRQTLKEYLKSILKEAWLMVGSEEMVQNYIIEKKKLLESIINETKNISENKKDILNGGVKFLNYLNKQWAEDLLYSWCFDGRMRAAKVLGIPLEKLPTTNNHLEGMNEYLKNNQLSRFQRNSRRLRADVLYIILVNEVIPNILTLRHLAIDLEQKKAERRKELNIMNPSDRKILKQEFLQVAYLSPSIKHDESAKKLLDMNKVIKYEIKDSTGNIYVKVESETTPGLIYTTCVYGQPTNICCQCLDFLQKGIMCKHLRAAALYIDELRKQEQYSHLPEMTFLTYKEAQSINYNLCANESETPENSLNDNDISDDDYSDDGNDKDINDESNNYDDNDDSSTSTSSLETLNYVKHIFGINTLTVTPSSTSFAQNQPRSKVIDINRLNVTAIHRQEFKEFLESTSRSLQTLRENSLLLKNLIKSEQLTQELCNTDQCALQTHLHNIIASNSFKEVQILVDVMHKDMNPRRSIISNTDILPLVYEAKQQRKPSYKSF